MRNVNIKVVVPKDRRLIVQLPEEVEPGEATITIIPRKKFLRKVDAEFEFPTLHLKEWPTEWGTLRREDMYGDDGR
jgi:hypothetical protein